MKRSSIVYAFVIALGALSLNANGLLAADTPQQGKSNSSHKIGTAAGTTIADCTKQGGTVETSKDGTKWCAIASSKKSICLVYKPGHEGDDRYCSQSVPAPN
jgi:hypothetical protein